MPATATRKAQASHDDPCSVLSPDGKLSCDLREGHSGSHVCNDAPNIAWLNKAWSDGFEPQKIDKPSGTVTTAVDGDEAQVVLDGTTGSPIEEPRLIEAALHDLELSIAQKYNQLTIATQAAKDAAANKKDVQEELNSMIEELSRRVRAPQPQQTSLLVGGSMADKPSHEAARADGLEEEPDEDSVMRDGIEDQSGPEK